MMLLTESWHWSFVCEFQILSLVSPLSWHVISKYPGKMKKDNINVQEYETWLHSIGLIIPHFNFTMFTNNAHYFEFFIIVFLTTEPVKYTGYNYQQIWYIHEINY